MLFFPETKGVKYRLVNVFSPSHPSLLLHAHQVLLPNLSPMEFDQERDAEDSQKGIGRWPEIMGLVVQRQPASVPLLPDLGGWLAVVPWAGLRAGRCCGCKYSCPLGNVRTTRRAAVVSSDRVKEGKSFLNPTLEDNRRSNGCPVLSSDPCSGLFFWEDLGRES